MRRSPAAAAWAAGLVLAALFYIVGTDRLLFRIEDALHVAIWRLTELLADLPYLALDVTRALALGLFVTFVMLAVVAARRGVRARGALLAVSLLFLLLVSGGGASGTRWAGALLLAGVGALVMTARLRQTAINTRATYNVHP